MNNALLEARLAPATLDKREKGKEVLVRTSMINYFKGICDAIDEALASFPVMLKKYGLAEYDNEPLQRAMLRDGFAAVQLAVRDRTLNRLEKSGLFPKVRTRLAEENVDAIPQGLRDEVEAVVRGISALNRDLDCAMDFDTLLFRSGKLRIPPKYRAEIEPRYTLEVSSKDRKTVERIREAASILSDLEAQGVRVGDEMRVPPSGGSPVLAPGLITRMVRGSGYTDAERLGLLHGVELRH